MRPTPFSFLFSFTDTSKPLSRPTTPRFNFHPFFLSFLSSIKKSDPLTILPFLLVVPQEVIPTQFVMFTVFAILGGGILYDDFAGMPALNVKSFICS